MSSEHYLNMSRGGLDYDLYVINSQNKDTTLMQLRDCTHDALRRLDERLSELEALIKEGTDDPIEK